MAYTSEFEGAQMDAVFRRVTNMVAGKATLTASPGGGYASLIMELPTDLTNPICLANVRYTDTVAGEIFTFISYNTATQELYIRLMGVGLQPNRQYEVYYMLME